MGLAIMAAQPAMISLGAIAALVAAAPVQAATLTQWQFDPSSTQLEVTVASGVTPRTFLLAQPTRIVMDLPNTDVGAVSAGQAYGGAVRQVRVSQFQPGLTRIVMELSPDATLAPEQVQLQQVGTPSGGQSRWVLRPVFVGAAAVAAQPGAIAAQAAAPEVSLAPAAPLSPAPAPPPLAQPSAQPITQPGSFPQPAPQSAPPVISSSSAVQPAPLPAGITGSNTTVRVRRNELPVETPLPNASATPPLPTANSPVAALSTTPATLQTTPPVLPPLEPGATELAVPAPSRNSPIAAQPSNTAAGAWQIPATLPPATVDGRPVTVTIPPLEAGPAPSSNPPVLPDPLPPINPLPTTAAAPVVPPSTPAAGTRLPARSPSLASGDPSPSVGRSPAALPSSSVAATPVNPNVLLPSGTQIIGRYPGNVPLTLSGDRPWQEVLVLTEPVRDYTGRVVFPAGSQVLGRFETGREGSRFVAQAISVDGRNQRLEARSERLEGDRQVSEERILRNSAIGAGGAIVLGLLTGGIGLVGLALGAGAGAATTYFTAPQPATIFPNQVIEMRLTQDLPRGFY
ncbi:MAG: hypothetical protein Fur0046_35670 [Cyanobacteria bacterium J069]